jgi:hypothetical protein
MMGDSAHNKEQSSVLHGKHNYEGSKNVLFHTIFILVITQVLTLGSFFITDSAITILTSERCQSL